MIEGIVEIYRKTRSIPRRAYNLIGNKKQVVVTSNRAKANRKDVGKSDEVIWFL